MSLYQIQLRRDDAASWTSANPILAQGEVGFETDTYKFKIGDGSTAWTSLAYFSGASASTLAVAGGGTGSTDIQTAINTLTAVASATNEYVLTKDTATANALWKVSSGGYWTESGALDYLTTVANKLAIGAAALISTEKVLVNGLADVIQTIIRGHSTQTSNILEVRKSDNTVVLGVTNTAGIVVGGTTVSIGSNVASTPVSFTTAYNNKVSTVTDGAGAVIDASLGNEFLWTAVANRTAGTTTNYTNGQHIWIRFKANGAAYTLTLPTATTGDFKYGGAPTVLSATVDQTTDYIHCIYNSVIARWCVQNDYSKGY